MVAPIGLLGESAAIVAVREQVGRLLKTAAAGGARRLPPILVLGETGTGKGLLAGAIHRASPRAAGPFVDVNCAAIPETLLEAELFGYERGAFTDARHAKAGLFQTANGGTIFLDELGLLPLALQAKLLKVIEERAVRRLGATRSEAIDVSIVAATSEDLATAVRAGRFRADLYHRLAVVTLSLPPLRDRGRDVLLLAEHFLARVREDYGLPPRTLTDDARTALLSYPWPGNVRELANVLERAALLADDTRLTAEHLGLPAATRPPAPGAAEPALVPMADETAEREQLLEVLRGTDWNITRAAARLGVPRNTLRYRVERAGLEPELPATRRRGGRPPVGPRPPEIAPRPAPPVASETRRVALMLVRLVPGLETAAQDRERALDAVAEKVEGFGGRVEDRSPDGLLAAFGLEPEEDAPRRAAHAALVVRNLAARATADDERRPGIQIAVHAAPLGVTATADGARLDVAARAAARGVLHALTGAAVPGSIAVSAAAARLISGRFDLLPIDGDADRACRLLRHVDPGRTRFVGRERELRLLLERFGLARAGQGQVVTVVGEPGIGKSRLMHELRRRLGAEATWIQGHAVSFGRTMPFHPVIDMLRRVFGIDDADTEPLVVAKLERGLRRLGNDVGTALPILRYMLSVDPGDAAVSAMDPKLRHAAIVRATHLLLERGTALRPHVLVLEDAHWCDAATEDWVVRLADGIATKRAMVILTYRPGYRPPFGDRSFHTGLALATLSADDSRLLARDVLGPEDLPDRLLTLVLDKADGNPFFVEELLRSLREQGAVAQPGVGPAAVSVPDTVQDVLRARIGRLAPPLRTLLETASVIGKDVPFALLRELSGRAEDELLEDLRALQGAEFLYERRVFPELEHSFKHALTHDVAYDSLEAGPRRALHGAIVDAVERLYPERLREHVEQLAYHAVRGERWPAAARYCRQAGAKAFERSANREAVASFEDALTALAHLPEQPETLEQAIDIRLALRSALLQLGRIGRIAEYLREAEKLAVAAGDRRRLAWVWTYLTIAHLFDAESAQAVALGERALALAVECGDVALHATARTPLGHACRERGDYRRAIRLFTEAIELLGGERLLERLGQGMPPALYARSMAAVCLADVGDFVEAMRLGTESRHLAESADLPFGLVLARVALGYTSLLEGRLDATLEHVDAALRIIEERDIPTWFPWATAVRGYALALAGRAREGVATLERALDGAVALPGLFGHSQWTAWLAHARHLAGDREEARRLAADALRLSRLRGERGYEAWALYVTGVVDASPDASARARALAGELGMAPLAASAAAP